MKRWMTVAVAGVALHASLAWARTESGSTTVKLPPPLRSAVSRRMAGHPATMTALVWSVILLDYYDAEQVASRIANGAQMLDRRDPALAKLTDWFVAQDRLQANAQALAGAAKKQNGPAMSAAFQQLAGACMDCHIAYLDRQP
jgi:hypothetical protein